MDLAGHLVATGTKSKDNRTPTEINTKSKLKKDLFPTSLIWIYMLKKQKNPNEAKNEAKNGP